MTDRSTPQSGPTGAAITGEPSALDRRRAKLQRAQATSRAATDAVADLDARLDHTSTQTREHEAALQAALAAAAQPEQAFRDQRVAHHHVDDQSDDFGDGDGPGQFDVCRPVTIVHETPASTRRFRR